MLIETNTTELSGNQTLHQILDALAKARRQGPRTGLPENMQTSTFVQHIKMRSLALAVKTDADHCLAYVQIPERNFGKPFRQFRVKQQSLHGSERIYAQHRLHDREQTGSRPCLRPIRFGVERRERMHRIARMPAETLRKPVVIEEHAGLKHSASHGV